MNKRAGLLLIALPFVLVACQALGMTPTTVEGTQATSQPEQCEGGILNNAALGLAAGSGNSWDSVVLEQRDTTKAIEVTKPGNDLSGLADYEVDVTGWMFVLEQQLTHELFGEWLMADKVEGNPIRQTKEYLGTKVKGTEPRDLILPNKVPICVRINPEGGRTEVLIKVER